MIQYITDPSISGKLLISSKPLFAEQKNQNLKVGGSNLSYPALQDDDLEYCKLEYYCEKELSFSFSLLQNMLSTLSNMEEMVRQGKEKLKSFVLGMWVPTYYQGCKVPCVNVLKIFLPKKWSNVDGSRYIGYNKGDIGQKRSHPESKVFK